MEIIPAVLTDNPEELEEKIKQVEHLARRVQIDVIDGIFAKNKTVGLDVLEGLETSLLLDFHLMVKDPLNWVEHSIQAGADRIIAQVEMISNQREFVEKVRATGAKVGLAIDLNTGIDAIEKDGLAELDVVLVMAVKSGFGGQEPKDIDYKIWDLEDYQYANNLKYSICVDGGIDKDNILHIAQAGADEFVVGHSLWDGNLEENMRKLEEALNAV